MGRRLLVLAADPGSYALDWSARAVTGADGVAPRVRRPRDAWRRLFLVDRRFGRGGGGRAAGPERLGGRLGRRRDGRSALVSDDPSGNGWYGARWPRSTSTRGRRGSSTRASDRSRASSSPRTPGTWRSSRATRATPACSSAASRSSTSPTARRRDPWPGLETVGRVAWAGDDRLWYARYAGTGTAIGELWLDGRREERWEGDAFIGAGPDEAVVRGDGRRHGHLEPPGPRRAAGARHVRPAGRHLDRLTDFNDAIVDGRRFPDVRQVRWTAPDGVEIEARLLTPRGGAGPWPMIVAVHGGPTWCWNAYFSDSEPNAVLLADAGYAVLQPNPRGSSGRGHAFAEAVIGDPGGIDFADIMAGVDWAIAEGIADPARLGIAGLSYGGYMAGWAVTQTDRFAAAVAISVVADYRSFHLTSEVATWDERMLRAAWDDAGGLYDDRSPVIQRATPRRRRWSSPASSTGAPRSRRASCCSAPSRPRAARRSW